MSAEPLQVGLLIVGAGQAAVQLVDTLRAGGYAESIVVVGDEPHPPYQRPPLSKGYLLGDTGLDALFYRSPEHFQEQGVQVLVDERVDHIERVPHGVRAVTGRGRVIDAGRLVLATGAAPRRLDLPGSDASGVVTLRTAADAERLAELLAPAAEVVVIGGGFVGLEVAASARKLGKRVTVLEAAPSLMGRAVGAPTSAYMLDATRRRGIDVVLDARIVAILSSVGGQVSGVELADGTVIPAQLVAMGVGVAPRTELAEALGLAVENGIVVDEHSLASDGWSIAVGDCANLPSPYPVDPALTRVRLESVNNAVDQAHHAAQTLLGAPVPYRSVPWFWSDQGDLKLQIAGLSSGYDEVVVRGDAAADRVAFLYLREGRLIAADCINAVGDFAAIRRALADEVRVPAAQLADPTQKLAAVFKAAATV